MPTVKPHQMAISTDQKLSSEPGVSPRNATWKNNMLVVCAPKANSNASSSFEGVPFLRPWACLGWQLGTSCSDIHPPSRPHRKTIIVLVAFVLYLYYVDVQTIFVILLLKAWNTIDMTPLWIHTRFVKRLHQNSQPCLPCVRRKHDTTHTWHASVYRMD